MSDRPQKYGYYFRITIEARNDKLKVKVETIIESNNSRNLLNDSTHSVESQMFGIRQYFTSNVHLIGVISLFTIMYSP